MDFNEIERNSSNRFWMIYLIERNVRGICSVW